MACRAVVLRSHSAGRIFLYSARWGSHWRIEEEEPLGLISSPPARLQGRSFNRVTLQLSRECAMTKTIRSQFVHEVGETVEGFVILEKRTVIPPVPLERRRGVYDYLVDVPPVPMKSDSARKTVPERGSFTRSTPDDRSGVVRRLPKR